MMKSTKIPSIKNGKRSSLPTRYPKRIHADLVGLAVQETHDNPQTLQLIPSKQNIENRMPSFKLIKPTVSKQSTNPFIISLSETPSREINAGCLSEVKIDILDENQCGDLIKKTPRTSRFITIDNGTLEKQPEIIYNSSKYNHFSRKKPRINRRTIKLKTNNFKHIAKKNSKIRRQAYNKKNKINLSKVEQIYSDVLSNVVSRSQVLKKALAKINLMDDAERISSSDGLATLTNNIDSFNSSLSPTKESSIIQNTFEHKGSSSSNSEDSNSLESAHSNIRATSEKRTYKLDIIIVAMARALATAINASKLNVNTMGNFTSAETLVHCADLLSGPSSNEGTQNFKNDISKLSQTIVKEKVLSNDDLIRKIFYTFIDQINSHLTNPRGSSDCTLAIHSDTSIVPEPAEARVSNSIEITDDNSKKNILLDKAKSPSEKKASSSVPNSNIRNESNDISIKEKIALQYKPEDKSDEGINSNVSVFKKNIIIENMQFLKNNFSLLTDVAVRANIKKEGNASCVDDVRNSHPTNEIWEQITRLIESAMTRLEKTLGDRIEQGIKTSLRTCIQHEYQMKPVIIQRMERNLIREQQIPEVLQREVIVLDKHLKQNVDMCTQCELVQKEVIDKLLLKLLTETPKVIPASLKPEIEPLKNSLEILKSPILIAQESLSTEAGKGDNVNYSTATAVVPAERGTNCLKLWYSYSKAFLMENMIVLTSVPMFLIVLFSLYGVIVIIMK